MAEFNSNLYDQGASTAGGANLQNMNTDMTVRYFDPTISDDFIKRNPLQSLLKGNGMTKKAYNRKVEHADYRRRVPIIKVVTNAASDTITVSSADSAKVVLYNILWDKENNKFYIITAISTTTLTIKEINSSTNALDAVSASTFAATKELCVYSNSYPESYIVTDYSSIANIKKLETNYNYLQKFYRWIRVDKDKAAEKWYGENYTILQHERAVELIELADEAERQFWIGKRAYFDNTSSERTYMTQGFNNYNIQTGTGSYANGTWQQFLDFMYTKATAWFDGDELWGFCNNGMFMKIAKWAENTAELSLDFQGKTDSMGFKCHKLVTPWADIILYRNLQLRDMYSGNQGILNIVDPGYISMYEYSGNGIDFGYKLETDIGKRSDDIILDRVSWTAGMCLRNEWRHSQYLLS